MTLKRLHCGLHAQKRQPQRDDLLGEDLQWTDRQDDDFFFQETRIKERYCLNNSSKKSRIFAWCGPSFSISTLGRTNFEEPRRPGVGHCGGLTEWKCPCRYIGRAQVEFTTPFDVAQEA
ncbi:hypothetical protein JTE90_027307 [Oedothorax gibbosus]|uniref:Uncharacterized protein n=1 Tax=Oedothorax gibbosus TaxID=931172 RepID=A0AAV6W2H6_9ARAC|nr:hypothetical protein JTE90_027307 [Oedothorax gibbosus]